MVVRMLFAVLGDKAQNLWQVGATYKFETKDLFLPIEKFRKKDRWRVDLEAPPSQASQVSSEEGTGI